jgi:hypothetical protein
MACARCNHGRGTRSIEAMISGVKPKTETKYDSRRAKLFNKHLRKAKERNVKGWFREDGTVLCGIEWLESIRFVNKEQMAELKKTVLGLET